MHLDLKSKKSYMPVPSRTYRQTDRNSWIESPSRSHLGVEGYWGSSRDITRKWSLFWRKYNFQFSFYKRRHFVFFNEATHRIIENYGPWLSRRELQIDSISLQRLFRNLETDCHWFHGCLLPLSPPLRFQINRKQYPIVVYLGEAIDVT